MWDVLQNHRIQAGTAPPDFLSGIGQAGASNLPPASTPPGPSSGARIGIPPTDIASSSGQGPIWGEDSDVEEDTASDLLPRRRVDINPTDIASTSGPGPILRSDSDTDEYIEIDLTRRPPPNEEETDSDEFIEIDLTNVRQPDLDEQSADASVHTVHTDSESESELDVQFQPPPSPSGWSENTLPDPEEQFPPSPSASHWSDITLNSEPEAEPERDVPIQFPPSPSAWSQNTLPDDEVRINVESPTASEAGDLPPPAGTRVPGFAASMESLQAAASSLRSQASSTARAGLGAAGGLLASGYNYVRDTGVQGFNDLARVTRPLRTQAGVVAAHAVQQAITCGIPTFCREMAAIAITAGVADRPRVAISLMMGSAVINVGLQALRHSQMNRHPDIAARAFHGITEDAWNQLPREEQAQLRERQQYQARLVTQMQLAATTLHLGIAHMGMVLDRPDLVTSQLAFDMRNWVYAGMRESLQATFAMTDIAYPAGQSSGGVNPQRMAHAATMYGAATVAANYLQDVLLSSSAVNTNTLAEQPLAISRFSVRDSQGGLVTNIAALNRMAAMVSALRAAANTAVEVIDAYQGSHHTAAAGNGRQIVNPTLTGVDYARLRDHSPMRIAWNSIAGLPGTLIQFMPSSALRSLLGNVGAGLAFGLTYVPVNSNYQAAAGVRRHVRTNPPPPLRPDTQVQQPINPTAVPETEAEAEQTEETLQQGSTS